MYYAFDVWKDGGVNFSFTHFRVSMFIAAIKSWIAGEHGQTCQITGEGHKSYIQEILNVMALCIILIFGNLSMHSTHGHNGVFSRSIHSVLPKDFFAQIGGKNVLCIPTALLVSKNPTLR